MTAAATAESLFFKKWGSQPQNEEAERRASSSSVAHGHLVAIMVILMSSRPCVERAANNCLDLVTGHVDSCCRLTQFEIDLQVIEVLPTDEAGSVIVLTCVIRSPRIGLGPLTGFVELVLVEGQARQHDDRGRCGGRNDHFDTESYQSGI